ncbi:MAG: rRNA maturation RNase YbeY [Acidobacteriota bacterium]
MSIILTDDDSASTSSSDDGPQSADADLSRAGDPAAGLPASVLERLPPGLLGAGAPGPEISGAGGRRLEIQNPCRYPDVRARRLRPWIESAWGELAPAAETLTVRFVSDREMRRLNASFRGRDESTDVLSFPGDLEKPWPNGGEAGEAAAIPPGIFAQEAAHLGDVVISVPTSRRQAAAAGRGLEQELRLLTLHGLLHCLGFDHERDGGEMEAVEKALRRRFLSSPQASEDART